MIHRRQFLQSLGLGAAACALGVPARAQEAPIRRLLVVSTGHGNVHGSYRMDFGGLSDGAAWDRSLVDVPEAQWSQVLRPLHRHRQRLLALDGLSLTTCELDLDGYRHEKGWVGAWTGDFAWLTGSDVHSRAPSLDQVVARAIGRPDRLGSLELQVQGGRQVSHAGLAQPLPLEGDPRRAQQRVFRRGGGSNARSAFRSRVLDYAAAEFDMATAAALPSDWERLQRHSELARQLEQRLVGLSEATCDSAPTDLGSTGSYGQVLADHTRLVAAAFACDMTRVATLSLGDLPQSLLPMRPSSGDVHDSWAHGLYDSDEAHRGMSGYMATHAEQLATILDTLEATPDPQGGTLLDHTLVVWGSEMADGWHGYGRYCVVLAGGGWHFDTGRYVHQAYGQSPVEVVTARGAERSGMPHQHLLVSVAQAMGLSVDHIGLAAAQARDGTRLDLTGPLAGLTGELG